LATRAKTAKHGITQTNQVIIIQLRNVVRKEYLEDSINAICGLNDFHLERLNYC
jgi:hypothetical protein